MSLPGVKFTCVILNNGIKWVPAPAPLGNYAWVLLFFSAVATQLCSLFGDVSSGVYNNAMSNGPFRAGLLVTCRIGAFLWCSSP